MSTRDRILDAAAEILRTRGVVEATTKRIAAAATLSEPALYRYFEDKEQLVLAVLQERLPGLPHVSVQPGSATIEDNLVDLAHAALVFYQRAFPMLGSLLADPRRLAAHRESMSRHGGGPDKPLVAIATYLRGEQAIGRVDGDVDAEAVASLLLGGCFHEAFLRYYADGPAAPAASRRSAERLVRVTVRPLSG